MRRPHWLRRSVPLPFLVVAALVASTADARAAIACKTGEYPSDATCVSCTPVAHCAPGSVACTSASNSSCALCVAGFFEAAGGTTCSACSPACGAGTYESAACTADHDRVCASCDPTCASCTGPGASSCAACPTGRYLSGGACLACAVCGAGTYASAACTASANTVCTSCPPGTFAASAGATSCASCGDCSDALACTTDRCDAVMGCVHEPVAGCEEDAGGAHDGGSPDPSPWTDAGTPPSEASGAEGPRDAGATFVDGGTYSGLDFEAQLASPDEECAMRGAGLARASSAWMVVAAAAFTTAALRRRRR